MRDSTPPPASEIRSTALRTYWHATQEPLPNLLFLFPLVVAYELGALLLRPIDGPDRLVAYSLVRTLFGWIGVTGFWLPGIALILTLLIWHLASGKPWRVRAWVLPTMALESVVLTLPMFVINRLTLAAGAGLSAGDPGVGARGQVILALGAGVFEELVFRLALLSLLLWALQRGARLRPPTAVIASVIIAALLFSACHLQPIGRETFALAPLWLRFIAGCYLSVVFFGRGLGICTGCHVAYNLMVLR
ncbi:CAAX amino terminal protease self- immunity [Phycisphaerae bacterium RAS1]|nr:CAAX amino terminal protease self- immunity [Phycisphaerae bacterium RAS1]